ncbi:hypothetical protein Q6247_26310, partial [Klebsiella pneumoniae]
HVGYDDDGGRDNHAMTALGSDVFAGLDDPNGDLDSAGRGGFGMGCAMVEDGTFSSFLDSLVSENQLAYYFGYHKTAEGGDNDDQAG